MIAYEVTCAVDGRRYIERTDSVGEAKRRGLTGTSKPEDFRIPDGAVALMLAIEGHEPLVKAMPTAALTVILDEIQSKELFRTPAGMSDLDFHRRIRRDIVAAFPQTKAAGTENDVRDLLIIALWTAFNHPAATGMRKAVSQQIRQTGNAYLTLAGNVENFTVTVGDTFDDPDEMLRQARGLRHSLVYDSGEKEPPLS